MASEAKITTPVTVTLLHRPYCPSCEDLLAELEPMRSGSEVRFDVIDISAHEPPPFAQPFVVPATYVGDQLWRYGAYPVSELHARLQLETGRAGLT